MDQAASQPARASSAALTHATTVAAAHAGQPAPARTENIAHTSVPAPGFWSDTMKPGVFWNAASAVATALAIFAAFLVPWLAERRQQRVRTSYAIRMLPPVFDEAVDLTTEAEAVYAMCRELKERLGEVDEANFEAGPNMTLQQFGWKPTSLGLNAVMFAVPTQAAVDRIKRFAATELPSYIDNRSWLMALTPDDAGTLQNAFSEALMNLRKCREALKEWPGSPISVSPDHVEMILGLVLRTREVSNLAARRLSRLLKAPFPSESSAAE